MNREASLGVSLSAAPQAERDPDEIDLLQYWHVLRDNRWLIAGVLGVVVALAWC